MYLRHSLIKGIISILMLLVCVTPVSAKLEQKNHIMQFALGSNTSSDSIEVNFKNNPEWEIRYSNYVSFSFSFYYQEYVSDAVALRFGAGFIYRGNEYEIDDTSATYSNAEFSLSTVSLVLPVTLRLEGPLYVGIGLYGGLTLRGAWADLSEDGDSGEFESEYLNDTDYGLVVEMGFLFNENLEIGMRYDHGFTDLIKTPWEKTRARTFLVTGGIRF